KKKPQSQDGLR
ncbi:unnamed protein product, partial [Didymodactylos carnosus]